MSAPNAQREYGHNRLLGALPSEDYTRFWHHLECVALGSRQHIYEPNQPMPYVYFPTKHRIRRAAPAARNDQVQSRSDDDRGSGRARSSRLRMLPYDSNGV